VPDVFDSKKVAIGIFLVGIVEKKSVKHTNLSAKNN
jgi:hypothetical protein